MTPLSHASCFNPGADLWILPEEGVSRWAKKVDWYLNFQLARVRTSSPLPIPEEIVKFISFCELPLPAIPFCDGKKNLVASHHLLPNRWSAQLVFQGQLEKWCKDIFEVWERLRKPTLRIFLPAGVNTADFLKSWSHLTTTDDFSLVLD